ncbi:hypothetical protein [Thalassotalea euphylliae]|uniref:MBL fold metallo-hydrolase n=1 Tax=Thalassotalea euphylliae TaxID=1655234 RepID=A0A3E0U3Q4_9GAMM|nr:hypothetical protein [Thalassotalea euphylliae]REL31611.1 hypothetical protein DXX94_13280 [Thalassotalea euphylliae]
MRINTFILLALLYLGVTSSTYASEAKAFIELLQKHYQQTASISAFSLTHSYFGRSDPYQSWDYQAPSRYKAFKVTDIDMEKQHYYQNVVHHFTGGLYLDEVHFQNDSESSRYERNGISLGKSAIAQSMNSFSRYKNLTLMNLDFLAVRPLLQTISVSQDISETIDIQPDKVAGKVTLAHRQAEGAKGKEIEYVFNLAPLRLESINNKARKRIFLYGDYRTSNGYHFAHSLIKHYNGDVIPSFITRIEKFEVIEQITPEKLTLPNGYRIKPAEQYLALAATEIAEDLYLINDASQKHNTLFTVNGGNIMVFGAPRSSRLSESVLKTIKQQFPTKQISGVYVTHPYREHITGLLPFVEQGAKVYADDYTIAAIKAYPRFTDKIDSFSFEPLSHEQVINGVQFYVLESARSKRQSFAYFAQSGTIYQSDFLEIARDNTIANILPSYSKQFIDFVRESKLKVKRIVAQNRNSNISQEVMNKAYQANTL